MTDSAREEKFAERRKNGRWKSINQHIGKIFKSSSSVKRHYKFLIDITYKFCKVPFYTIKFRSDEWYNRCREWLKTAGGHRLWELDMVWDENKQSTRLKTFRFQVGYSLYEHEETKRWKEKTHFMSRIFQINKVGLRNYHTPTDHTNGFTIW